MSVNNYDGRSDSLGSLRYLPPTPKASFSDEESGFLNESSVRRLSTDSSISFKSSISDSASSTDEVFNRSSRSSSEESHSLSERIVKPVSPEEMGPLDKFFNFVSSVLKWLFSDPDAGDMHYSIGKALEDNENTIIPKGNGSYIGVFREGNVVTAARLNSDEARELQGEGNIRPWREIEKGNYFEQAILLRAIEAFDNGYEVLGINIENGWAEPVIGKGLL